MESRLATSADKDKIFTLIEKNCEAMKGSVTAENFKKVAETVLGDIDYGFFIMAEEGDKPLGMMYITYEWSDWRNSVFFWLQASFAVDESEEVHTSMLAFLEKY